MATSSSATAKKSKVSRSLVDAPSQLNQVSRKGKRAWRKNIDIQDVETGLENLRAEERVTGSTFQSKTNEELFRVDIKGDDQIRKSLPRLPTSQLTSAKILSQRSAIPAVFSRIATGSKRKYPKALSREEKSRLLRIGKRPRKGPFNSIVDLTEIGCEAVKKSGNYNPWTEVTMEEGNGEDFRPTQKNVKAPCHPHPRDIIEAPPIAEPHQGTSYNPPAVAHQQLLLKAHEIEEQRLKGLTVFAAVKEKFDQGWKAETGGTIEDVPSGMLVDQGQSESDDEERGEDSSFRTRNRLPERKTKQQRRKAAKLLAEKRALAERVAKKRMLSTVESVKTLQRTANRLIVTREEARAACQLALRKKAKSGLAGQRIGKHKVAEGEVDVRLGEELSETLREMKPEGNLFRDRFLSLQQRALVEPRAPVLPKKRTNRIKEYEKHAWKRFQ